MGSVYRVKYGNLINQSLVYLRSLLEHAVLLRVVGGTSFRQLTNNNKKDPL